MSNRESLVKLKQYLEELKTIEKEKISDELTYESSIIDINGVKYISLDDIKKKNFITSEKYLCRLNNGEMIVREKLLKGGKDGSAVIVIPVTTNNEVIVTVEPRVFTENTTCAGFPAGYVESGESSHVAALRELQEEVGCRPKYLIPLAKFYQDEGISSACNISYLAIDCEEGYPTNPDPGEFVKYVKCSFDDVLTLNEEGYFGGSNSQLSIERAKTYFDSQGKVKKLDLNDRRIIKV